LAYERLLVSLCSWRYCSPFITYFDAQARFEVENPTPNVLSQNEINPHDLP
jgi:hypothetical protein